MRYLTICLLGMFFIICAVNNSCGQKDGSYNLKIKKVILDSKNVEINKFVTGKDLYPNYAYYGLNENFLIAKTADITFLPVDIESIKIQRMKSLQPENITYMASIFFRPAAAGRLKNYTSKNLNEKIALEIDGEIFVVLTILEVSAEKANVSLSGKKLEEIKVELSKICKSVTVENSSK